jgi:hypothetical protein
VGAVLKIVGGLFLGTTALISAGCGMYARGLKEANAEEARHNRTQAKTLAIAEAVKRWSAAHGGLLPSNKQFQSEVRPTVPSPNGFNLTQADVDDAKTAFRWNFAGGTPQVTEPSELEVGRLSSPEGGAILYADLHVAKGYPKRN